MASLLQTVSGMFSARVGRGRPGVAEKRFLISHFPPWLVCIMLGWFLRDDSHARTPSFEQGQKVALTCGLTVPKIAGARGLPIAPVSIRRAHPAEDDNSSVHALWRADQFIAAWRDKHTNTVTILKMSYPFPKNYQSGQSLPADVYYREASALPVAGYPRIALTNILDWMSAYYHQTEGATEATPVSLGADLFDACFRFVLKEKVRKAPDVQRPQCTFPKCREHDPPLPTTFLVYVFQVRMNKTAAQEPEACYALEIRTACDVDMPHDAFAKEFLEHVTFDATAHESERHFWSTEKFDSFVRAHAVRSVSNFPDEWMDFHSRGFVLITNNRAYFDSADSILDELQQRYDLYSSVLPPFNPALVGVLCPIRVYESDWEFEDSISKTRKWAQGIYARGEGAIVARRWGSTALLAHEAAHQYLHVASGRRSVSTWFNEGFACYFQGCKVEHNRLVAEPIHSGHLLVSMMKDNDLQTVSDVFTADDFYEEKAMWHHPKCPFAALRRAKNYTSSWGIIYFFREAPSVYPDAGYENMIPLFWETLRKTGDSKLATQAVLQNLYMPTFLSDFQRYFLALEEEYARRERRKHKTEPKCDCEYCLFLQRTGQPFPAELALGDEPFAAVGVQTAMREVSPAADNAKPSPGLHETATADAPRRETGAKGMWLKTVATGVGIALLGAGWWRCKRGRWCLLVALLATAPVLGDMETHDGHSFFYRVVGGKAEISNGGACAISPQPVGALTIPSTLGGHAVTAIGDRAFVQCTRLEAVTLPASVTRLGPHAFLHCSALKTMKMPGTVSVIGAGAFYGCFQLTDITLPDALAVIEDGTFYRCFSLADMMIPASVQRIGDHAFGRCFSLASITIPRSVSIIGRHAFSGCSSLKSITLPRSVVDLGEGAFKWCSDLISVSLPDSVTSIGKEMFSHCASLSSFSIPSTVTTIGEGAFDGCSNLRTVTIPSSVTVIGDRAFRGCYRLESVAIPDSVTLIGSQGFHGCHSLGNVTFGARVTVIGPHAFYECFGLSFLVLPRSLEEIGHAAFARCANLVSVVLPEFVTVIEANLFSACTRLASVAIPEGVRELRSGAFEKCGRLTSVTIPDSVTAIGAGAFSDCHELDDVTLGGAVSHIGGEAFSRCVSLADITIPDSVTTIRNGAFKGCIRLTSVRFDGPMPKSVGRGIYDGTPEELTSRVKRSAKGWGPEITGMWKERPIRYLSEP